MNPFPTISTLNNNAQILFDPLLPNPEASNVNNANLESWSDWIQTPALPLFLENNVAPAVEGLNLTAVNRVIPGIGNLFETENSFFNNSTNSQIQTGTIPEGIALSSVSQLGSSTTSTTLVNPNKGSSGFSLTNSQFEEFSSTSTSLSSLPKESLPLNFISPEFFNFTPPSIISNTVTQVQSSRPRRSAGPPTHTNSTKPSQQADEAIPEAALHLLRLGLASTSSSSTSGSTTTVGGTGSVATTNTTIDDDASCDEDAEGESDATSFHSEEEGRSFSTKGGRHKQNSITTTPHHSHSRSGSLNGLGGSNGLGGNLSSNRLIPSSAMDVRSWNYGKETVQIPIVSVRGGPQSVSSSRSISTSNNGGAGSSTRVRQHRPARAMSNAGSNRGDDNRRGDSPGGNSEPSGSRRTSGRVRKTVLAEGSKGTLLNKNDDDDEDRYSMESEEDRFYGDQSSDDEEDKKRKGKGKAKARKSIAGIKRSNSSGLEDFSIAPPAKRVKVAKVPSPTKSSTPTTTFISGTKPRRQKVTLAATIPRRTFAATVEINELFPRFYRSFPVSRAFHPDSFVNRLKGVGEVLAKKLPRVSEMNDINIGYLDPTLNVDNQASTSTSGIFSSNTSPQQPQLLLGSLASSSTSSSQLDKLPAIDLNPVAFMPLPAGAFWNKTGEPLNLYQPRFIKGTGEDKAGLCPICVEPPERGGEGEEKWLKVSSF